MPEYRVRYVVGQDPSTGRPRYHSVTISSEQPPDENAAQQVAYYQEAHLYEEDGADFGEIEVDEIRELAPLPLVGRARARFVYDYDTGEWVGPLFEGRAHQ